MARLRSYEWRLGMIVKMQSKGREVIGLQVDETDVQRYFPEGISVIELQLDHLQIQCWLRPDFWRGHAEIRDPRLTAWLNHKNFNSHMGMVPISLAMIPLGEASFELRVLKAMPVEKRRRRLARHEGRGDRESDRECNVWRSQSAIRRDIKLPALAASMALASSANGY